MKTTWIVVASSSQARFFTADTATGPITEFYDLVHSESRLHARDITSDLPGKGFDRQGEGRHGLDSQTPIKKRESIQFAREVSEYLNQARRASQFGRLIIVAAPAFLGELRSTMHNDTASAVIHWLEKNIAKESPEKIRSSLPDRLWGLLD
ncbi:MAG: host attachment protein [Pseudomonadales bacterium]|nr:host attachment protein [Pseudomonadales bacterium]